MADPAEIYCYCVRPRGRSRVASTYLVERRPGSKVVARIEPLGDVRTTAPEAEVLALGLRRRLWITGKWRATRSGRHSLVAVRALPRTAPATPRL
ncbi:MAG: hypothetical protein ACRDV0_08045 [Acidimicrobiales bacterium]